MVEVETKLNQDALLRLNRFHLFKKNKLILLLFMSIFILLGILISILADKENKKIFGIVFAVIFGFGFPLLCLLLMNFTVWLQLRSSKFISNDTIINYKFDDNMIFYQAKNSGMVSTTE